MARNSLTKAIEKLIESLDTLPPELRQKFKQETMPIFALAKAFQDGSAISEAEAKMASLEEQIANLEIQLKKSNAEVERFRKEEKSGRRKSGRYHQFNFRFSSD